MKRSLQTDTVICVNHTDTMSKKMFSLRLYGSVERGSCVSGFEELVEKTSHISSTWKLERFPIQIVAFSFCKKKNLTFCAPKTKS